MRTTTYTARPRYGPGDVIVLLWRELLLMVVVFVVVFVIGAMLALSLPKTYTAESSLFVRLGREYVYQPTVGDTGAGAVPQADEVVQSEAAILNSTELKRRVVEAIGPRTLVPEAAEATGAPERVAVEQAAVRALASGLKVGIAPASGIIQLSFEHRRPDVAARVLNAVIDEYLDYRREVFRDVTTPLLRGQLESFESDLDEADTAYEAFLRTNDIGDFDTAQLALSATYQSVFTERMTVDAQLNQANGRLATLRAQLAAIPPEIALQQDLNISAQDQILQLRTEREQLLARYQPDSQPVRDIEARIGQLQQYVATGTAVGAREMRVGPNPMWMELESQRIQVQAERDSLISRRATLAGQLAELSARQARLNDLESRNATLAGRREVLTTSIREFTTREAQSRAAGELAQNGADNITVIERATTPSRGASLKAPALVLAFLFAGFTALCVGLLRVFTRRGFTTPGSAARTLELPVLAVAPMKAR